MLTIERMDASGLTLTAAKIGDEYVLQTNDRRVSEFPDSVELLGVVYTLEVLSKVGVTSDGHEIWEGEYA